MIWHRLGKDMTDTLGPFTLQLVLGLRSAKLKLGTGWCIYICYLDQTWKKKRKKKSWIKSFVSPSFQTCHLSAICVQNKALCFRQLMTNNVMQASLSPAVKPSPAQLTFILGQPSVNERSNAQPRNVCYCTVMAPSRFHNFFSEHFRKFY